MARGPQASISCPVGAVSITAGSNIQTAVNANPAGTAFCLGAGVHSLTSSIIPKSGNTFCGVYGAILDGSGWSSSDLSHAAFSAHNQDIDDVTIQNLIIRNMPTKAIHAFYNFTDGWLVEYSEIDNCPQGIFFGNTMTVQHCLIHGCHGDDLNSNPNVRGGGIGSYRCTSPQLIDCEIWDNGPEQKIFGSTNVVMRDNYVHHCANGLWSDYNETVLIEDNIVEDCTNAIYFEVSRLGTIRNNIIRRCGVGVFMSGSQDSEAYGNTMEACFRGMQYFLDAARLGESGGIFAWTVDLEDNYMHDNTVIVPSTPGALASTLFLSRATPEQIAEYQTSKNLAYEANSYTVPYTHIKYWMWYTTRTFAEWNALGHDDVDSSYEYGTTDDEPFGFVPSDGSASHSCCSPHTPTGGDVGTNPDPVGELPPWEATCSGGALVEGVADLSDGESWL